ncbi:peptidase dimerization domain-containing protein, partial [Klebsiella pneumoniae]
GPILGELQELSQRLGYDEFLGKGTLTVSEIFFTSPSRCAVADSCAVSIDRRLTWGETWEGALDEIRALPAVQKANAVVSMYNYDR